MAYDDNPYQRQGGEQPYRDTRSSRNRQSAQNGRYARESYSEQEQTLRRASSYSRDGERYSRAQSGGQPRQRTSSQQQRQATRRTTTQRSGTPTQRTSTQRSTNRAQYDGRQQRQYESRQQYADISYGGGAREEAARYNDVSRYRAAPGSYNNLYDSRINPAVKQKSNAPLIAGIVIALIIIAAIVWFFVIPKPFDVTVNGKEVTVDPGSTVATLVEKGYAHPTPGNLVAVDGELITAGEGEPFAATINGKSVARDAALSADNVVEIDNGGDLTEDYTSAEEAVPFETVNDDMSFEAYWFGSIHEMNDGTDGLKTVKTGTISGKTVEEITVPAKAGGYHNYTVQTDQPVIALTFDDGPWPETTNQILDILEENGAKATFFTIGEQVEEYADAVKRADAMGCEVVTHTWDHASGSGGGVDLTLMSAEEQIWEVTEGYAAIARVLGKEPVHLLRAPGGNFHDEIINTLWSYVDAEIGWNVDTEDWSRPGVDAITSRILSAEPGDVILMHDGGGEREQTVEALRIALPQLIERGYKCVTVSELLTYNNTTTAEESSQETETAEMEG